MSTLIDLRSDTVTVPTPVMRQALAAADVGDDQYGEDPSCNALEEQVADLLGKPAALFTVTGSLANLLGVRALVRPGQELICEARSHITRAEMGAHAAVSGVTTRTWSHPRGLVDLDAIQAISEPGSGPHFVSTAAISVENTHNFGGGAVQPYALLRKLKDIAAAGGIGIHLDGARLWNAAVATGIDVSAYAEVADTVSVCLSKGLGAPVGSLLAGPEDVIAEARVWRKRLGAAWRQAGVLAAAGRYALDHHRERLADDHANARLLADRLAEAVPGIVDASEVETNIVVLDLSVTGRTAAQVADQARAGGVLIGALGSYTLRLVTHLGADTAACRRASDILIAALR